MNCDGLVVDLFAGGGGASTGLEAALGRSVSIAVNHNPVALAVHQVNHTATRHLVSDVFEVDPRETTGGAPVEVLWASPDCTHFSVAKGGKPKSQKVRSLADVVVNWARDVRPRLIFVENVREFLTWGPLDAAGFPVKERAGETFGEWKASLESLGYRLEWKVLDASDFGAPTRRRRLFIVARCDGKPVRWPEPTHGPGRSSPYKTAADCIDWSIPCPSIFQRKRPLAEKTLARIAAGIRRFVLESAAPFVVTIDNGSSDGAPASIDSPLSTIIASNPRHALVAPTLVQTGYGERDGQRPRSLDLQAPLGTVVAGGSKHALVSAFLAKHFGGVVGTAADARVSTVTTRDHHSLVTATLDGLPDRRHEVRAFLAAYYGSGDVGQDLREPLRTVVTKDRFGLVAVNGVDHVITDIGMRMLEPHELLRAQFGRFAESYDLSAATTKTAQVRLIGNSVCPEAAEALVRANVCEVACA